MHRPGWIEKVEEFIPYYDGKFEKNTITVKGNEIFLARMKGVGNMMPEEAIDYWTKRAESA